MMVSFNNMAILFLGIEILSISLYVLAGSNKESFFSNEAAFKYFIMGALQRAFYSWELPSYMVLPVLST